MVVARLGFEMKGRGDPEDRRHHKTSDYEAQATAKKYGIGQGRDKN
jgi:hypothetical protein